MNQIVWTPGVSLASIEEAIIKAAYVFYKGNKTATAQSLGISVRTLDNKLVKYEDDKVKHDDKLVEARARRQEFLERSRGIPGGAQYDTAATPSVYKATPPRYNTGAPSSNKTQAGIQPQSVANASEKQSLPVSEREKV